MNFYQFSGPYKHGIALFQISVIAYLLFNPYSLCIIVEIRITEIWLVALGSLVYPLMPDVDKFSWEGRHFLLVARGQTNFFLLFRRSFSLLLLLVFDRVNLKVVLKSVHNSFRLLPKKDFLQWKKGWRPSCRVLLNQGFGGFWEWIIWLLFAYFSSNNG